jgi:hypothetical protein
LVTLEASADARHRRCIRRVATTGAAATTAATAAAAAAAAAVGTARVERLAGTVQLSAQRRAVVNSGGQE